MAFSFKYLLGSVTALRSTLQPYARPACACTVPYCAGHPKLETITYQDGSRLRLQGFGLNTDLPLAPAPYDGSRATRRVRHDEASLDPRGHADAGR